MNEANIGPKIVLEGEKEYKQSIAEVNKSMKMLQSEINAVSAEYDGNANSIDALRAKNSVLVKQQEEQDKKLKLLRGALESVSKQYGENSVQAKEWQTKLNNAYADLSKINKELSKNEKYMKEAEQATDKTAKSIDKFGDEIKQTKKEALNYGDVLKANLASEAIGNGVQIMADKVRDLAVALVDVVKGTASYADNILVMSTNTGISTDTLQELNYMAELTDTSLETISTSMQKNIRSMASAQKGAKDYVDAYKSLKVDAIDPVTGALRDSQTVFWESIDALGKIANETERDSLSMKIFGRNAQDLNSIIAIGTDGVAKYSEEARNMGAVLSVDTLEKLAKTDDAFQRMAQQIEISKRTIGAEMAPAMTEAITRVTEKIDDVDEKVADFAGGALETMTDGFIWLVDNIDLVAAGLKGVTAALITKKAAEGVEFAVQAYKSLTTVTEAATGAQAAYNTVSKANAIGAISAAVVGLGTFVYSYAKSSADAAEETRKLNDESLKLLKTSQELNDEVNGNIQNRKKEVENLDNEYQLTKKLTDSLYDLANKSEKTNEEKAQMITLVDQLNRLMPELNLTIDEQTGLLDKQEGTVRRLTEAQLELKRAEMYGEQLIQIELDLISAKKAHETAETALNEKLEERTALTDEYKKKFKTPNGLNDYFETSDYTNRLKTLNEELVEMIDAHDKAEKDLQDLAYKQTEVMNYLNSNSPVESSANAMEELIRQYKDSMETNASDAVDTIDEAVDNINDIYEEASNELEKRIKKEKKALEESQEDAVKEVEKASEKELKILEKAHQKKLDMIDEEYLEKMKNVDEDRYNELKKVQDEIVKINNTQEAEDRALQLKEEAEKKAELQSRIENAKTVEERIEAQDELADYIEELARERLKEERKLQTDILENEKDTINDAFDAKIQSLEDAKDEEKKFIDESYENEKTAIEERYKLKLEAIKDDQELEKENLEEKQAGYKTYLEEQKDLAIQNAKDIYENDLKEFKLNNALKYDEFEASEKEMMRYIKDNARSNLYSGIDVTNSQKILNASSLEEMLKYYNQSSVSPLTSSVSIDYSAMGEELKDAIKTLKLTVVLDKKTVGTIVEDTVNSMIR